MKRTEIVVLRSSLQTDDWVWDEYSNLIGRLTIDCGAHCAVVGEEYEVTPETTPDCIMVATGGVENLFMRLLPQLSSPVRIIADGRNNSLAAALEILTCLQNKGIGGCIIHGSADEIAAALNTEAATDSVVHAPECRLPQQPCQEKLLSGLTVARFGEPSDWLIASDIDETVAASRYGIKIKRIPIEVLIGQIKNFSAEQAERLAEKYLTEHHDTVGVTRAAVTEAMKVYGALRDICRFEDIDAFTIRCFDILGRLGTTSCLAISMLNDEGVTAGCEGDMQSLLTMLLLKRLTGEASFMANPSGITESTVKLAHCTVPATMCKEIKLRTHFESDKGAAIDGTLSEQFYTIVKWGGEKLDRCFVAEAESVGAEWNGHLCRTQLTLSKDMRGYLLRHPIGNHHMVAAGRHAAPVEEFMRRNGVEILNQNPGLKL